MTSLKQISIGIFSIGIFLVLSCSLAAQTLQTLSGVADSIDGKNQKLRVIFEHPVTGEESLKEFEVLPNTGFKNVKRLEQIQLRDPISIDYEELESGKLRAVYIEVVSLEKVPFTKEQIRKKTKFLG